MNTLQYIQNLIGRGIWSFTTKEIRDYFGISPKDKLRSLRIKERIITPARGFHVIVPEEYRESGRLPVDRYIDALMAFYKKSYCVGLLSAASYWGAAQQSPQIFQVITNYDRRNIRVGRNKIVFYMKKNINTIPLTQRKTATGYFNVSTPEVTFLDLIYYYREVGGLEYAGTLLRDLVERIEIDSFYNIINHYPVPIIQRSGYLMELNGYKQYCDLLDKYFKQVNFIYTYLNPSGKKNRENKYERWKLFINESLDIDS